MKKCFVSHNFLLSAVILSFLLAFLPFIYFFFTLFPADKPLAFAFLVPFFVLFVISICSIFLHEKFPIFTNILTFCINFIIIFFVQCCMGGLLFLFLWNGEKEHKFNNPEYYEETLSYMEKDKVSHFPKKIPSNAKNVEINANASGIFGSRDIFLKFDTDKKYIENEIQKYNFISVEPSGVYKHNFSYSLSKAKSFNFEDFTFYVINDRENENLKGHHFPYHYGIGVNKNHNCIIYYYIDPD